MNSCGFQHLFRSWVYLGSGLILLLMLASGCSSFLAGKAEAENKMSACFGFRQAEDYEQLVADCYGPEFFDDISKEEWTRILQRVYEKLGPLQAYELSTWKVENRTGEIIVQLAYQVQYEKYEAQEVLWLRKQRDEREYLIIRHSINSTGLLLE
jgi:hypothetical protein